MRERSVSSSGMPESDETRAPGVQVQVLLAIYNGETFLREQMDSILAQDYADLQILVRDDGSKDNSISIVREYVSRYPGRVALVDDGFGPTGDAKWNFIRLIQASSSPYICFSDQDDVWLPDKVSRSIAAMKSLERQYGPTTPLLVFSDLVVVDNQLKTIFPSFWKQDRIDPSTVNHLRMLIGQNVLTGCTAMLNRPLGQLSLRMPPESTMHDRWVALLSSAMGHASYLQQPTVLYRQHGGNVVGANMERISRWALLRWPKRPAKRIEQWWINQDLAAALLRVHGRELPEKNRRLLEAYVAIGNSSNRFYRMALLFRYRFFRKGLRRKASTIFDLWNLDISRDELTR